MPAKPFAVTKPVQLLDRRGAAIGTPGRRGPLYRRQPHRDAGGNAVGYLTKGGEYRCRRGRHGPWVRPLGRGEHRRGRLRSGGAIERHESRRGGRPGGARRDGRAGPAAVETARRMSRSPIVPCESSANQRIAGRALTSDRSAGLSVADPRRCLGRGSSASAVKIPAIVSSCPDSLPARRTARYYFEKISENLNAKKAWVCVEKSA